jgi:hypothetical protein
MTESGHSIEPAFAKRRRRTPGGGGGRVVRALAVVPAAPATAWPVPRMPNHRPVMSALHPGLHRQQLHRVADGSKLGRRFSSAVGAHADHLPEPRHHQRNAEQIPFRPACWPADPSLRDPTQRI